MEEKGSELVKNRHTQYAKDVVEHIAVDTSKE
jgi:hypothetical protein